MEEPPKKLPISMLSSSEESSDSEREDELMAADSYEGDSDGDNKDVGRKRKSVSPSKTLHPDDEEKDVGSSSNKIVSSPAKTNQDGKEKDVGRRRKKSVLSPAKTNEDDKDIGRKKIVCRANPDDYPQLASFLRQNHMEEELQRNWTVIGDENASKLQQKWIKIMDRQMGIAAVKFDLLQDIFDVINPQANLFLSDFR